MKSNILLLNYDYTPINIINTRRFIILAMKDKIDLLNDAQDTISTVDTCYGVPSIVRMKYYINQKFKNNNVSRRKILIRDNYICQYCGKSGNTIDHIIPECKNGETSWNNCVCSCKTCNLKKGNKKIEEVNMKLLRKPKPSNYFFTLPIKHPKEWNEFLL